MIQRTLVLVKPDGVARGLIGEVIRRFESRGLKVVALKMVLADEDLAKKHYTEDIERRRGKEVRDLLISFLTEGPVVALAVEGVDAIENVRKLVGDTESKSAMPGTIRGDFSHVSFEHANQNHVPVRNIVHASSNEEDAAYELGLWFDERDFCDYKRADEFHVF